MLNDILFIDDNIEQNTSISINASNKKAKRSLESRLLDTKLTAITDLYNNVRNIYELDLAIDEITNVIEKCVDFKLLAIFGVDKFTNELFILKTRGYVDYKIKYTRLPILTHKSVVTHAARTKKTIHVPDVDKIDFYYSIDPTIKSNLAVPIIDKNELLGVVITESETDYSKDDINLLELLAEIIALAISQHRIEIIIHDLNVLMTRLMNINNLEEGAEEIAKFAETLLNFEIFCILDTRKPFVRFIAHRGYESNSKLPKFRRDNKKFFVSKVYMNRESIYVDNLKEYPDIPYYEIQNKVQSEYCIPIIIHDEVVGLVNVENVRPLDRHELAIFESLAGYAKLLFRIFTI
jgi:sigma-B regulation protein RsbU (phosphoserine phosphatase)